MAGEDADAPVDLDAPDDGDAPAGADGPGGSGARSGGAREPGAARGSAARLLGAWPDGVPGWARGPAAVVVLVLLAAAVGAVAGGAHREARDQRRSLEESLTVGYAFLAGEALQSGQLRAQLRLALANHADRAVTVRLQGLTTPHQGTLDPPDEVRVAAGGVASAPLEVAVDCAAFRQGAAAEDAAARSTPSPGSTATTALLASVRSGEEADAGAAGAEAVDVRLPVLDGIARALDGQLAAACGGAPLLEPQTGWLWKDDGALRVTVTVPALGVPVQLALDGSDGLGATADPPLPRPLGPGETAVVDLRVSPDCRTVGDGSQSWLDLQARDGQGASTPLGRPTGTSDPVSGVQPWLARRIALACG